MLEPSPSRLITLRDICVDAAQVGHGIDLTGCDYGYHRGTGVYRGIRTYYYFLAGFVRTLGLKKILEIGTAWGGSMMAMDRGCTAPSGVELVTVDKKDLAGPELKLLQHVVRVHGDSLSQGTVRKVRKRLAPPIDLLFIDSRHRYEDTKRNLEIYWGEFRPRFVIFDDIHLNDEMGRLWRDVVTRFPRRTMDISRLVQRTAGFGVLECESTDSVASHG